MNMEHIGHIGKSSSGGMMEQKPDGVDEWMRVEEVETAGVDYSFTKRACEGGEDSMVSAGDSGSWEKSFLKKIYFIGV